MNIRVSESGFKDRLDAAGVGKSSLMYEDEIPKWFTDKDYDEWYEGSFVDGVRMGLSVTELMWRRNHGK